MSIFYCGLLVFYTIRKNDFPLFSLLPNTRFVIFFLFLKLFFKNLLKFASLYIIIIQINFKLATLWQGAP